MYRDPGGGKNSGDTGPNDLKVPSRTKIRYVSFSGKKWEHVVRVDR